MRGHDGGLAIHLVNLRTRETIVRDLEIADTAAKRAQGLLGRDGLDADSALWLEPCSSIHMFFMRFAIDVIYLDRDARVLKMVAHLKPWRLSMAWGGRSVVELPAGALARLDVQEGDQLRIEDQPA